jgi:hypothetical protein
MLKRHLLLVLSQKRATCTPSLASVIQQVAVAVRLAGRVIAEARSTPPAGIYWPNQDDLTQWKVELGGSAPTGSSPGSNWPVQGPVPHNRRSRIRRTWDAASAESPHSSPAILSLAVATLGY